MLDGMPPRLLTLSAALLLALALLPGTAAAYDEPPEPYAGYQPQTTCRKKAGPGTLELTRWLNRRFEGGRAQATVRACKPGGVSEHKDGRAIDWTMSARVKADRVEVRRFLQRLFRADAQGNRHALARRMGVMYVIWNDRMWASYDEFVRKDYGGSVACRRAGTCSPTLRHRDHVHISMSKPGGRGRTSWYEGRL